MKQTRFTKLAALLVALVLVLSMATAFVVSATGEAASQNETKTIEISKNIYHLYAAHIALNATGITVPDGSTLGIIVWEPDADTSSVAAAKETVFELTTNKATNSEFYITSAINPKNYGTEYQIAFALKAADGAVTIVDGTNRTCSIIGCAQEAILKDEKAPEEEKSAPAMIALYKKIIAYGEAAGAVLNK